MIAVMRQSIANDIGCACICYGAGDHTIALDAFNDKVAPICEGG